jgi:hypothetical protein
MAELSSEQKEKRKDRFKSILKSLVWLNPSTKIHMAAKTIQDRVSKRRSTNGKALSAGAEKIIDGIQKSIAMAVAKNAGLKAGEAKGKIIGSDDPITMASLLISKNGGDVTIDSVSEKLAETPTKVSGEEIRMSEVVSNADGGVDDMALIFAKAKSEANKLSAFDKAQAVTEIEAIQKDIKANIDLAKTSVAGADKKDIAEANAVLDSGTINSVASSIGDGTPIPIVGADAAEKSALKISGSFFKDNKKLIFGIVLIGVGYYLYTRSNSSAPAMAATGGAVGAVAAPAPAQTATV